MAQPPEKKARVEEAKAPEEEHEKDAKAPGQACYQGLVVFHVPDTTMNVPTPSSHNLLKALTEGSARHLLAGARASVGMKAGRYMFEAKIVEFSGHKTGVIRVGVSTSGSSLLLGEDAESVCFDLDGSFLHMKKRTPVTSKSVPGAVYAVLVNLDKKSTNFNTISLFKDGVRASSPQPLPEGLKGKTLFPTVTFKGASVHVSFGPEPLCPLSFTCRMLVGAEKGDVVATPAPEAAKKFEVVYPVGLPGEGAFDWCDMFLKKNPEYTEISDRALAAWGSASGYFNSGSGKTSKDKPDSGLEDARRVLLRLAPLQPRNFVLMELKGNLIKSEREANLDLFPSAVFTKRAYVAVGEPTPDFAKYTQELVLKDKQLRSDNQFRAKQLEERRAKLAEKKKKEQEKAQKKAAKKAAAELAKRKAALEKAKAAAAAAKDGGAEKKEEEAAEKEPEPEEEEEVESEKEDEEMPEQVADPPKVELDEEDKKIKFHANPIADLTAAVFSATFTQFTLPEKGEGFDDIKYVWSKATAAPAYLKQWISNNKLTTRIEGITPSREFHAQLSKWQQEYKSWADLKAKYLAAVAKKEADKKAKAMRKEATAKAAALKKEAAEKAAAAKKDEPEKEEEKTEDKKEEPEVEEKEEEEEEEEEQVDFDGLDIFGLEDVCDLGGGMPLVRDFQSEDWAMMNLRFELYLMIQAFRTDCADPERAGIYLDHLDFYYQKYYKKPLVAKDYGVETLEQVLALVPDTIAVSKAKVLQSLLPEDMERYYVFIMITEEARRHRTLLLNSGDESVRLKIAAQKTQQSKGGKGGGKGYEKSYDKGYEKGYGKWGNGGEKGYDKWGKGGDKGYDKWGKGDGKSGWRSAPYKKSW